MKTLKNRLGNLTRKFNKEISPVTVLLDPQLMLTNYVVYFLFKYSIVHYIRYVATCGIRTKVETER